jgi:hypothetical protein
VIFFLKRHTSSTAAAKFQCDNLSTSTAASSASSSAAATT